MLHVVFRQSERSHSDVTALTKMADTSSANKYKRYDNVTSATRRYERGVKNQHSTPVTTA